MPLPVVNFVWSDLDWVQLVFTFFLTDRAGVHACNSFIHSRCFFFFAGHSRCLRTYERYKYDIEMRLLLINARKSNFSRVCHFCNQHVYEVHFVHI